MGAIFGAASNYRTWEVGVLYQVIEKDALFAQLIDSDFAGGTTDTEGLAFRVGYAPVRNWMLNATYFLNNLQRGRAEFDRADRRRLRSTASRFQREVLTRVQGAVHRCRV